MVHRIFVASSEWGGTKGGINLFNKALVEALAWVVRDDVEVHAVVSVAETQPTASGHRLHFHSYAGTGGSLAQVVEKVLRHDSDKKGKTYVVGHDVHTGGDAIEARDTLKSKGIEVFAATFCHMDYSAYDHLKDTSAGGTLEKAQRQREIVCEADIVFAVGPLLKQNFEKLRTTRKKDSGVVEIIPGFPDNLPDGSASNPSPALKFFFSGRIEPTLDRLKNSRLILKALVETFRKNASSTDPRWRQPATFIAYGFTPESNQKEWFCDGVDASDLNRYLVLRLEEFSDQLDMFKQLSDSHVAIMPSVHEGFGLSGWEAICAGIPLICSQQSGLAMFLERLFEVEHELPSESIDSVRLFDSDMAVDTLARSIENFTKNYDRRRSHARVLAEHLRQHYSWERCARDVASVIGLASLGSVNWPDRMYQGKMAAQRAPGGAKLALEVQQATILASQGQALNEWEVTCTALNYLSDIGKERMYASRDVALKQLTEIAVGIASAYDSDRESEVNLRCSGRFDVAWRFMAAASSLAENLKDFLDVIPHEMMADIRGDSFLRRELFHYSMKYSARFKSVSEETARELFGEIFSAAPDDPALQIRFARLEAVFAPLASLELLSAEANPAYAAEKARCAQVRAGDFDLNDLLVEYQHLGPTALALSSLDQEMRGCGIDQLFEVAREKGTGLPPTEWRGDKLLPAALLGATVHPKDLIKFIEALSHDEEEALRWAAIDLAFSPALRKRLYKASQTQSLKSSAAQLKARLGGIVDKAIESGEFHPWMQREFLKRFYLEHAAPTMDEIEDRFTLNDFPVARQLIGPSLGLGENWPFSRLHPEVRRNALLLRSHVQRIMLVLPPISLDSNAPDVSKTSTPPLGLGMIGSQLLARGHDVQLADCHRMPAMREIVIDSAGEFQWVGFNAVLPTLRSVLTMAKAIKAQTNPPVIVVGGPAVTARSFRNAASCELERKSWDFEICDGAESNFALLIEEVSQGLTDLPPGIIPNDRSDLVVATSHSITSELTSFDRSSDAWPELVLLDRRVFSTPLGEYEPQKTRALDGTAVEAHVVMSRGCDWNCTFCTERLDQSGGERRRPVASVEVELRELARRNSNLRIQFVDDNLLPQIAALGFGKRSAHAKGVDWAEDFLNVLGDIRRGSSEGFGWRGIFRVEDFFAYELAIPNFIERLASTGCRMLAFGVEHGNEERRQKWKDGRSASNDEFSNLFRRLKLCKINSKAYFILGGPKETAETSEDTIRFALESGVSLAYFALYKQFVPALKALRNEQTKGSDAYAQYSNYDQLQINWDHIFSRGLRNSEDEEFLNFIHTIDDIPDAVDKKGAISAYDHLSRLGFRFSDLVKYNDHHSAGSPSADILQKVNFGNQSTFESKVASAYIRFYMRPQFIETYRGLIEDGY